MVDNEKIGKGTGFIRVAIDCLNTTPCTCSS